MTPIHTPATIRATILSCTACPLRASATLPVPWRGPAALATASDPFPALPPYGIALIGEAPGKDEDMAGAPFVGRAGQVLDAALRQVGIDPSTTAFLNANCCRPPSNRRPHYSEALSCRPHLHAQVAALDPAILVPLGTHPLEALLGYRAPIGTLRGMRLWREVGGRTRLLLPTFHPAGTLPHRDRLHDGRLRSAWLLHDLRLALLCAWGMALADVTPDNPYPAALRVALAFLESRLPSLGPAHADTRREEVLRVVGYALEVQERQGGGHLPTIHGELAGWPLDSWALPLLQEAEV